MENPSTPNLSKLNHLISPSKIRDTWLHYAKLIIIITITTLLFATHSYRMMIKPTQQQRHSKIDLTSWRTLGTLKSFSVTARFLIIILQVKRRFKAKLVSLISASTSQLRGQDPCRLLNALLTWKCSRKPNADKCWVSSTTIRLEKNLSSPCTSTSHLPVIWSKSKYLLVATIPNMRKTRIWVILSRKIGKKVRRYFASYLEPLKQDKVHMLRFSSGWIAIIELNNF